MAKPEIIDLERDESGTFVPCKEKKTKPREAAESKPKGPRKRAVRPDPGPKQRRQQCYPVAQQSPVESALEGVAMGLLVIEKVSKVMSKLMK